jgi:glycosyltransferase involved in cell wall biosynthesis
LPIVLFVHGDEVWNDPQHRSMRWYEPWMLKSVSTVAAVSDYTIRRMAKEFRLPLARFRLFPNAVDALEDSQQAVPIVNSVRDPMVLTVTRLGVGDREKNVDTVIRAFAKLQDRMPNATYEIIGDGCLRPELEALALKLGVADRVKFRGQVDDHALDDAYRRASVFVLPSSKEGFGIVYLEAWQRSVPVICADEGAPTGIISDGVDGLFVRRDDVSGLERKLFQLLTDERLRAKLGEQGRAKVQSKYLDKHFGLRLKSLITESVQQCDAVCTDRVA